MYALAKHKQRRSDMCFEEERKITCMPWQTLMAPLR
jgi:hypothetical protein